MFVATREIDLHRSTEGDVVDVTQQVQDVVTDCGLDEGSAHVFVSGSTGAVTTMEFEPGLKKDLFRALECLAPSRGEYAHDEMWHDGNGHSHVRASLLGPSLVVPVLNGRLALGRWQQIVFLELDNKPRDRRLLVQVIGRTNG